MISDIGISQTLKVNEYCKKFNSKEIHKHGFGQSPFKPPKFFRKAICENIDKTEYLPVTGLESLRESISSHYSNYHNVIIDKNNIIIGPGSKLLIYQLTQIIDNIYFVAPFWVSYINQLKLYNRKLKITETTYENNWKITPEQLDSHENNSYLFLNSPNNPTGQVYSEEELNILIEVCKRKNIKIISDEIYQYLDYNKNYTTIYSLYPENTIVLNGLSKWCHSGGYRLGYIIFPNSLNDLKSKFISFSSETFSCVNTPLQYGAISVFNSFKELERYNSRNIDVLIKYNDYFYEEFTKLNIKVVKSCGAFYMFLDFDYYKDKFKKNKILSDDDLCEKLLLDTKIIILAGNAFGMNSGFKCRFSFTDFSNLENEVNSKNKNTVIKLGNWLNNL